MFSKYRLCWQTGFTLIEVIITIVVLSVAATAIFSLFTNTIRTSANPVIQQQAVAIAEAYLEEILLKQFDDPDGIGGESRANFDNVGDYDGLLDSGAVGQNGNAIAGLSDYNVAVSVNNAAFNGIPAIDSLLIRVSVKHRALQAVVLHAYRSNY